MSFGSVWKEWSMREKRSDTRDTHCPYSPTGAHWYILDQSNFGECKFCGRSRQFPNGKEAVRNAKKQAMRSYGENVARQE